MKGRNSEVIFFKFQHCQSANFLISLKLFIFVILERFCLFMIFVVILIIVLNYTKSIGYTQTYKGRCNHFIVPGSELTRL